MMTTIDSDDEVEDFDSLSARMYGGQKDKSGRKKKSVDTEGDDDNAIMLDGIESDDSDKDDDDLDDSEASEDDEEEEEGDDDEMDDEMDDEEGEDDEGGDDEIEDDDEDDEKPKEKEKKKKKSERALTAAELLKKKLRERRKKNPVGTGSIAEDDDFDEDTQNAAELKQAAESFLRPAEPKIKTEPVDSDNEELGDEESGEEEGEEKDIPDSEFFESAPKMASKMEFEEPQKFVAFTAPSTEKLQIEICDPKKETDGSNFFTTYLIKSKTTLESYTEKENQVRHRFTDFINLNQALINAYPSCIIPPLPEKNVIESFITGDRFSPEFTERRRRELEIYMQRIARHPVIQSSDILRNFLESVDMSRALEQSRSDNNTVLDGIGDSIINSFSKIKNVDEKFVKAKEKLERLEVNLQHVEKLHTSIVKQERALESHMNDFAIAAEKFGETDGDLESIVNEFSNTLHNVSKIISEKALREEQIYIGNIRGYINYCQSYKDALRARDQKQMDYEGLSNYLKSYNDEYRKYENNPAHISSGITSFVSRKYDEMKGTDPRQRREEKMNNLQKKIEDLKPEVERSERDTKRFDDDITKEIEYFDNFQIMDFRKYLNDYIDIQIDSYQKNKKIWDELIQKFEKTTV